MIKVLLFDFYGVFLPDAYSAWLAANSQKREGVFAELIRQQDKGISTRDDFLKGLSDALGREVSLEELHPKGLTPDTELIALARSLKTKYKICLFSNASPRLRDKLIRLGIADLFEEIIISSEIGHAKPSDEAFAIAIKKTHNKSSEILFIDDNPGNIAAALRNNMQAYLYTSAESLRQALRTIG